MSSATSNHQDQDALLRSAIDRSLRHPVMFFLTSGAAWLAVSIILGIVASAKVHSPEFLATCSWLTYGRVFPAHMNALIYGWGFQAAFAIIIWMTSRLSRKECIAPGLILTAGHIWNLAISLGIVGILSGHSTGIPWMEFPSFVWPVLSLTYFVIVIWSFIQFRVRPEGHVYISQWYLLAAMVWFPWVFISVNTLVLCLPGHPVMAAGVNAWYKSALMFLFFTPVALGAAYYLAPKVTGRPIHSYSMAKLGFWSLAIIAPWAGMQKLTGAPIPYFLPYVGAAATAMLFVPTIAAAINILKTMTSSPETMAGSPSLRFTAAGIVGLIVLGFAAVFLNMPSTLPLSQFSLSGYGFEILAIYGFFTFVMFGAVYFIVPRVTRREWLSRRLITVHFLFSVYGIVTIALVALFGGLQQGAGQEDFTQPWVNAARYANPYAVATTISWCFILFSNIFFFLHLTLMWLRLGRRSSHPTLLVSGHHGHVASPHGEDGDIDNAGPGHATAAH